MASKGSSGYSQGVPKQMTGLHFAAYFGLRQGAMALLKNKHDLDLKDTYNRTPVSYAAEKGHEAVVKLLLEKGAELETKSSE
jgi:ankyrin repeat protein